jgi:hypothetical protein
VQEGTNQKKQQLRERFEWLRDLSDDELAEVSMCEEEGTLSADEEYFDVSHPERGVIRGGEQRTVPQGSCYISKFRISNQAWNRLTEIQQRRTQLRQ